MTRFARLHNRNNRSSCSKVPEEATSWLEFKMQMKNRALDRKDQEEQGQHKSTGKTPERESKNTSTYPVMESSWCDFDLKNNSPTKLNKKSRRQKLSSDKSEDDGYIVPHKKQKFKPCVKKIVTPKGPGNNGVKTILEKKNRKSKHVTLVNNDQEDLLNLNEELPSKLKKKNKHVTDSSDSEVNGQVVKNAQNKRIYNTVRNDLSEGVLLKSKKKQQMHITSDESDEFKLNEEALPQLCEEPSSKNKKKHKNIVRVESVESKSNEEELSSEEPSSKKKKKSKHIVREENDKTKSKEEKLFSKETLSKKKRHENINRDENEESISNEESLQFLSEEPSSKKKKKRKNTINGENYEFASNDEGLQLSEEPSLKKKKKLKHMIDENDKYKLLDEEALQNSSEKSSKNQKKHNNFTNDESNGNQKDFIHSKGIKKPYRNKGTGNEIINSNSSIVINGETHEITKFDGFYVLKVDADRINDLRQKMIKQGRPKAIIEGIIRRHRRNAEKTLTKKKKKLCFHCREGVHLLSDCPKLGSENDTTSTGICYKCGSTEHNLYQCKAPGKELKFAKCFICNENGHLSKQCPDNPRGLYPQGGSCRICGDVTHLKRDCPELIQKKKSYTVTVGTIGNSIESLDEDYNPKNVNSVIPQKRVNKIVKFD